jgi:hypothetical protein
VVISRIVSLNNITAIGTNSACQRLVKYAPPNNAIAAMGVKLKGCGMNLAIAASTMIATNVEKRVIFMIKVYNSECLVLN